MAGESIAVTFLFPICLRRFFPFGKLARVQSALIAPVWSYLAASAGAINFGVDPEFRAAALALLIPCDIRVQDALLTWIADHLTTIGIATEDQPAWLREEVERWRRMGEASRDLRALFSGAIFDPARRPRSFTLTELGRAGDVYEAKRRNACLSLSQRYFDLHGRLQELKLTAEEARLVLSYAGPIISFAVDQRMSAAEISKSLGARDRRLSLNWRPVARITSACGCAATFGRDEMIAAYGKSVASEPALLADLSVVEATNYVGELAVRLGCEHNLAEPLRELLLADRHDPYLMILHFQLSPLDVCDHAVTFAYEFSPRGLAANWLVQRYVAAGLAVAQNPYLNNAKALLRFDRSWAWGREDHLLKAHALVTVLEEVEALGALPKAELGRYICSLLVRVIRISSEQSGGELPDRLLPLTKQRRDRMLRNMAAANTGTHGVLEQRLVDVAATIRHRGWVTRGRGDSVFAASTFRRKLGDVEVVRLSPAPPRSIGYESHGGRVTTSYVDGHIATFITVLHQRREELEAAAPLTIWLLRTVFVAHSFEANLPRDRIINLDGQKLKLQLHYETFADIAAMVIADEDADEVLVQHFALPLNQFQVPATVRRRALSFIKP